MKQVSENFLGDKIQRDSYNLDKEKIFSACYQEQMH